MPKKEKQNQWKLLVYLLILKNNTQIWKTVQKQLNQVYDLKVTESETIERLIANRSQVTAKSISDTAFKTIKSTIAEQVAKGNTDLRDIKRQVSNVLTDVKPWKVDQIAQTELTWAYGEAQHRTYVDNGVTEIKWICGSEPCEICADNEGEIRKIGDNFTSGDEQEPVHPNCKCETVPVF
jgi:SPP1 gp7 family putative phage head morphogenesis protein